MNTIRRSNKLLAVTAASALVFAACGGSDDVVDDATGAVEDVVEEAEEVVGDVVEEAEEVIDEVVEEAEEVIDEVVEEAEEVVDEVEDAVTSGGDTLIWAHEQEPPDLHLDDPENNLSITSWIRSAMIEGLYGISGSTEYYPELLASEVVLTSNDDGTVTGAYTLRDGLVWNDGDDLTADDVKWTFDVILAADGEDEDGNPNYIYLYGDYTGIDTITDFTVSSATEFSITWSSFFAGYKGVLNEVYPMHQFNADPAAAAAELNEGLRDWTNPAGDTIASSGPMIFDSWDKGVQLNMVRNDSYNGSNSPDSKNDGVAFVDGIQVNFVTDTDAQVNALLAQESQIVFTQPQLAFEDLSSNEDFTVNASPGPIFEHWGLNLNNPHLAIPSVREALAFAMDKSEVMAGLYTPLFGDSLPAEGLGNTMWLSNQSPYENHALDAGYGAGDVESARAALEAAGYT